MSDLSDHIQLRDAVFAYFGASLVWTLTSGIALHGDIDFEKMVARHSEDYRFLADFTTPHPFPLEPPRTTEETNEEIDSTDFVGLTPPLDIVFTIHWNHMISQMPSTYKRFLLGKSENLKMKTIRDTSSQSITLQSSTKVLFTIADSCNRSYPNVVCETFRKDLQCQKSLLKRVLTPSCTKTPSYNLPLKYDRPYSLKDHTIFWETLKIKDPKFLRLLRSYKDIGYRTLTASLAKKYVLGIIDDHVKDAENLLEGARLHFLKQPKPTCDKFKLYRGTNFIHLFKSENKSLRDLEVGDLILNVTFLSSTWNIQSPIFMEPAGILLEIVVDQSNFDSWDDVSDFCCIEHSDEYKQGEHEFLINPGSAFRVLKPAKWHIVSGRMSGSSHEVELSPNRKLVLTVELLPRSKIDGKEIIEAFRGVESATQPMMDLGSLNQHQSYISRGGGISQSTQLYNEFMAPVGRHYGESVFTKQHPMFAFAVLKYLVAARSVPDKEDPLKILNSTICGPLPYSPRILRTIAAGSEILELLDNHSVSPLSNKMVNTDATTMVTAVRAGGSQNLKRLSSRSKKSIRKRFSKRKR